jgi:hypothetical protein
MATQTISTVGEIPEFLEKFYVGEGKPDDPNFRAGLLDRGFEAIFPDKLTGAAAYAKQFQPLIEQGLIGAGTVAPMSQFQQGVGTQLAGMTMPDQFALGEQSGQASAAGFQALMGVQAPEFGSAQAQQYMSPYFQNVVDAQQRQAIDAARQAQLGGNLAAARQGTYGGARQALLQGQRESGLRTQLGDIQARVCKMLTVKPNNSLSEIAPQDLKQGETTGSIATVLVDWLRHLVDLVLNSLPVNLMCSRLRVRLATSSVRSRNNRWMHNAAQLQDQAQYGQTQVGQLSNLLRGIPLSDTTQQNMTPPPSFASQLTGLGLTGIGLYNLLGGGK